MASTTEKCSAELEPLTRTADNAALYAALTGAELVCSIGEPVISTVPGYRLVRVDDRQNTVGGNEFEIALVDDTSALVAYYAKITVVDFPCSGNRAVARCRIWRSADMRHTQALRDISQRVLFGYLVRHYDVHLDEAGISDGGKFYWHRQISRAIYEGLYVYLYDPLSQELRPLNTQRALNEIEDQAWSCTNHKTLQALISSCSCGSS
ncbi:MULTISPECIES: hypothetical protein [unclassified Pseudomonas]|uniref:hypothetical protein n=1 Tax=unclassified Pseudomonas TaxID=196821 RepID=UPI000A1FA591|nr:MULTISPECIES: hypothetical protein [unclassified Pseudomonas]